LDTRGRHVEADAGRGCGELTTSARPCLDVGGRIAARYLTSPTALTGPNPAADAVDTESAPVVSIQIEGDQVPVEPAVDEGAGFGEPL